MEFGLDLSFALIDDEIKLKKQDAFNANRELYLKNLRASGKKYQFKKGHAPNRTYFSKQSMDRTYKNLAEINQQSPANCPICNQRTKHLPSHLYNAHGLMVVHKDKYNETIKQGIIKNNKAQWGRLTHLFHYSIKVSFDSMCDNPFVPISP